MQKIDRARGYDALLHRHPGQDASVPQPSPREIWYFWQFAHVGTRRAPTMSVGGLQENCVIVNKIASIRIFCVVFLNFLF